MIKKPSTSSVAPLLKLTKETQHMLVFCLFPFSPKASLFPRDPGNLLFRLRDHRLRSSSPEYANPVAPNVDDYGTSIPRAHESPKC